MVKWGRNIVDVVGGDIKKREVIIVPRYWDKREELLVLASDLTADGGLVEILKEVKRKNEEVKKK